MTRYFKTSIGSHLQDMRRAFFVFIPSIIIFTLLVQLPHFFRNSNPGSE